MIGLKSSHVIAIWLYIVSLNFMEITRNDPKRQENEIRRRILLKMLTAMIVLIFSVLACAAQNETIEVNDNLVQSSKIIESSLVLKDFMEGRRTTRVIVSLVEPERFRQIRESEPSSSQQTRSFKDTAFREELRAAVRASQEQIIRRLDREKVRITNRFVYVFGFSAEVTLEGLKEIEELDEVVSISKDRVLEGHPGKQGGSVK